MPGIDAAIAVLVSIMESAVEDLVDERDPLGLDAAIARGHIVLLVQIEASHDEPPGDPVLRVFRGTPVDGSLELDPAGRPMFGQRFRGELLAEGSFAPAGAARRAAVVASFAAASSDPSPAPPLDLARLTHIALDQCAGLGLRGRLGGSWAVEDAGTWFRRLGDEALSDEAVPWIRSFADLDPDPTDPRICRRISFGLSFDVVPAELVD